MTAQLRQIVAPLYLFACLLLGGVSLRQAKRIQLERTIGDDALLGQIGAVELHVG